ncbi:MAG: protein-methionine-sulfoxide reductase catalytic subunit MsrP [Gammaproteobacteria bacterium]|jgi:sulfoxide reductase catalytic subunit YedY|nr:protein-methionine-sulfoxide reductase catalytic subunit MsrP [Chromatiales bacterium]MDP6674628.1 protein-methionine-sulfoxide reductase catalytic subunit MsrP [Gammaproteobacteria bacterium]
MLIRHKPEIRSSEITPEHNYLNRRGFISSAALAGTSLLFATSCSGADNKNSAPTGNHTNLDVNSLEDITRYNNFYEFGLNKEDPEKFSGAFNASPWSVTIDGEAEITGTFNFEDIIGPHSIEERIYRLRCVEAWSMVVPWNGIPLGKLLQRFKPTSKAKFVSFETVYRPEEMPGQRAKVLDFPYREGLTIDEAMHPLTLLATGLYGADLPNQNGAPLRLIVPWKYGFKGIKSIVRISFTETRPYTTWSDAIPTEYGFYANVNPAVDHPRWSQARERRIGSGLFAEKQPTLMFNGYADEVASLYAGLDLTRYF